MKHTRYTRRRLPTTLNRPKLARAILHVLRTAGRSLTPAQINRINGAACTNPRYIANALQNRDVCLTYNRMDD